MTEKSLDQYKDISFDHINSVVELAEVYARGPYQDNGRTNIHECYSGIIAQYDNAERNNYENAAQVLYIDRSRQGPPDYIVELKAMWFDEDGRRTDRPVRNADGE